MVHSEQILEKIKKLLIDFGFIEKVISNEYRSETNYVLGDLFCIPQYIGKLGFLIEYAHSFDEAQKHWHEDGDSFPLAMGEDAILSGLENEIRQALNAM
jgi:hypothetical protein